MRRFAMLALVISLVTAASHSRADDTKAARTIIGSAQATNWIGKQVVVTGLVAQVSIWLSLI